MMKITAIIINCSSMLDCAMFSYAHFLFRCLRTQSCHLHESKNRQRQSFSSSPRLFSSHIHTHTLTECIVDLFFLQLAHFGRWKLPLCIATSSSTTYFDCNSIFFFFSSLLSFHLTHFMVVWVMSHCSDDTFRSTARNFIDDVYFYLCLSRHRLTEMAISSRWWSLSISIVIVYPYAADWELYVLVHLLPVTMYYHYHFIILLSYCLSCCQSAVSPSFSRYRSNCRI